jgi:hypothetical protein
MEYVLGIKQKGIKIFHHDIKMAKKDVVLARYSLIGTKMPIVHVANTN